MLLIFKVTEISAADWKVTDDAPGAGTGLRGEASSSSLSATTQSSSSSGRKGISLVDGSRQQRDRREAGGKSLVIVTGRNASRRPYPHLTATSLSTWSVTTLSRAL